MKRIIFLFFLLCLFSCDPVQNLKIKNNSNDLLFVTFSTDSLFKLPPVIYKKNKDTLWEKMNYIYSNEELEFPLVGKKGWESFICRNSIDSSLTVFYFEKKFLFKKNMDTILLHQESSFKMKYYLDSLKMKKWELTYP